MSDPTVAPIPELAPSQEQAASPSPVTADIPPTAPAVAATGTAYNNLDDGDEHFIDDGHIHVCVRIRDVPCHPAHTPKGSTTAGTGGPRKSVSNKEANKICISTIDNVVVMHDPKGLDDASALARDTNNVVQLLTDRAKANGGAHGAGRTSTGKSATARTRSSQRRSTFTRGLTSTATANYYECDQCITSMDESAALRMPLIRSSDFLQPPPYGSQEAVYCATARHAVKAAVDGINSCVFAYGQTGSGKTYTLFGDTSNVRADPGVVPRTLDDLFARLQALKTSHSSNPEVDYSYTVAFSFFEIYQNDVYCLLSRQGPLHVQFSRDPQGKKETMVIHDLQQQTVASAEKAYPLIELGLRRRQTGETGMNARSSRSHAIFQIRLTQFTTNRETRETVELHSTINLVDLAGSERQKTAKTEGKNREEGIQINQSLATLARVINDIASGAKFINYRDSLLTMVLKDNLGGNSKTFMIATVSPVAFSYQESCSTLTYAKAVRKIRNRPTVNRTFQTRANLVEQNARLKSENEKLKDQMEAWMKRLQQQPQPQRLLADSGLDGTPNLLDGISPIRGGGAYAMDDLSGFLRAANHVGASSSAAAQGRALHDGVVRTEALVAATSAGLTTPLLVTSHRRYTSVAGIGMACVEGGAVRVTSLVSEQMIFPLAVSLGSLTNTTTTTTTAAAAAATDATGRATTDSLFPPSVSVSPEVEALEGPDVVGRVLSDAEASPPPPPPTLATCALGHIELERVCQRSCEQHFWVRYVAPAHTSGLATVLTVQLNGKDLGASRRELYHGDVICAYVDDPNMAEEQHLLTYHYVDLNCLSRTSGSTNRSTLGQLAISVELPEDMENLTLENIQQLQRDNAKLLDMVRQQAQAVDYHVQKEASRARLDSITRLSSATGSRSLSPNPRTHHEVSGMPADTEEEALLRRAREAGLSEERLDSVMRENAELHKKAARRNATLDALAEQLAALEAGAGGDDDSSAASSSSSEEEDGDEDQGSSFKADDNRVSVSVSPSMPRGLSPTAKPMPMSPTNTSRAHLSLSCVSPPSSSSSSSSDDEEAATTVEAAAEAQMQKGAHTMSSPKSPLPLALRAADAEAPSSNIQIFYENTEGTRERYNAAVRQREQQSQIMDLEAIIDDLRMQLAMLESRLRVAKDDTMEEELARQAAEAERDALARQLQDMQAENAELARDNNALEIICHQNEEALHQATEMNEEEIERRLAILAAKNTALHELARLWKRRTMRHIALGYGAGRVDGAAAEDKEGDAARARPAEIPWAELRYGATADIAKQRLAGADATTAENAESMPSDENHVLKAVDEFEQATALEALIALEAALKDFESENRRLQDEVNRYEAMLRDLKDLIARLRGERDDLEKEAANASANEEESRRLKGLLDAKMAQLQAAEASLEETQLNLTSAIEQTEANKRRARKNNEMLLSEQKRTIDQLEDRVDLLQTNLNGKDEELRNLLRYMEENELGAGAGGSAVQDYQLRGRLEDLIADAMNGAEVPTGYSAFPADFEFSEEMIALIRVCLRILLDRLKVELYVLNRQNLHKLGLIMPTVQLRPDAQFHSFMHELRGVVVEIAGRAQRIGGRWSVSEADVLGDLVDHRRRRAGGALYGLLVWYDHWDMSPKLEHVCYMELIRNADRVLQIARQVRQQDALNTNATSTLMMPIPGRNGASDAVPLGEASKKSDETTIQQSCDALNRMNASMRRSNLARFCNSPSKLAMPVEDDYELNSDGELDAAESHQASKKLFRRTATALVMSQTTFPFSRTATGTAINTHADLSPTKLGAGAGAPRRMSDCPMPFGRRDSWTAKPAMPAAPPATDMDGSESPASRGQPQDRSPPQWAAPAGAARSRRASGVGVSPGAFGRVASSGAMPVSAGDIAYVASSELAFADSINTYNFARRASLQNAPAETVGEPLERKRTSRALPFSRNASAAGATTATPSVGAGSKLTRAGTFTRSATAGVMPVSSLSTSPSASKLKATRTAAAPARTAGRPSSETVPRPSSSNPRRSTTGARASSGSDAHTSAKRKKKLVRSQTAVPTRLSGDQVSSKAPRTSSSSAVGRGANEPRARPRTSTTGAGTGATTTTTTAMTAAPHRTTPGSLAAPRIAGGSLFARTKSTVTGPAATSSHGKTSATAARGVRGETKLMRSQTVTAGLASDKVPRRSGTGGAAGKRNMAKLSVTEAAAPDLSARSLSLSTMASPKPRTPCGATSKTSAFAQPHDLTETTGESSTPMDGRTSAGGPTPGFYNPNVLNALRERSTSEANQANTSGKAREKGSAHMPDEHGKSKKKRGTAAHKLSSHTKRK